MKEQTKEQGVVSVVVKFIKSEYPLGTTDGLHYTVYPRV